MRFYSALLRPLLFGLDAERAHGLAIDAAELASRSRWLCAQLATRHASADPRLAIEVAGIAMATPLGLAAGFDKSARGVPLLSALGFGHVEVGSISIAPSAGNPGPRLFRLPQDRAIVVNYGLPNDGAERVAQRVQASARHVPLGINLVSTNRGPQADAEPDDSVIGDYLASARCLQPRADYLSLNLSCPNTREGRGFFHDRARLRCLLEGLATIGITKPLFLKVAPFGGIAELESFLQAVEPFGFVSGFSVNLPSGKPGGLSVDAAELACMPGAVSGRPAAAAADRAIAELYRRMDRARYRIIGSGGVFSAADAYRKLRLGASMVQLLTALVYEGPGVVARLNRGLAALLRSDGVAHAADAVGVDVR
jgi:dihydroorotate dehydrogenase (fumarate)/dihydroorotate dehydrogenase